MFGYWEYHGTDFATDSAAIDADPKTREFKDYGHVHRENWRQYQRYVAADDTRE